MEETDEKSQDKSWALTVETAALFQACHSRPFPNSLEIFAGLVLTAQSRQVSGQRHLEQSWLCCEESVPEFPVCGSVSNLFPALETGRRRLPGRRSQRAGGAAGLSSQEPRVGGQQGIRGARGATGAQAVRPFVLPAWSEVSSRSPRGRDGLIKPAGRQSRGGGRRSWNVRGA